MRCRYPAGLTRNGRGQKRNTIFTKEVNIINKVELVGRMTRAPELRQSQNGRDICIFSVAVDRDYKNDQGKIEADFPRCIAFDRTADFISRWFNKGKPIEIVGRLSTGSYENKNGDTVYTTDVVVEKAGFVPGSKSDGNGGGYSDNGGYNNDRGGSRNDRRDHYERRDERSDGRRSAPPRENTSGDYVRDDRRAEAPDRRNAPISDELDPAGMGDLPF